MLTKEECVKARDIIHNHVNFDEMSTEEFNDSIVVFNNLINEHFELVEEVSVLMTMRGEE